MNKNQRIDYAKYFIKAFKKVPFSIKIAFRDRLSIFINDPYSPILHNHELKGGLQGLRSINVTGDWRALYREYKESDKNVVVFELIGTHSQLYR